MDSISGTTESPSSFVEWTFLEARTHFSRVDVELFGLVSGLPDPVFSSSPPTFESLSRAIVGQQLSTRAAATIWQRLIDYHGGTLDAAHVLDTQQETHRSLGVSAQKHAYIQDLALHYAEDPKGFDEVDAWDDDAIIASWTRVKGIGKWTVQMHLMFALRRPDVFAPDDLGIRRSMEQFLGVPRDSPKGTYVKRALCWGPFRTAACRFLWDALSNQPK
jgi:DNA-3-methyladenine glycosylase II